MKRCLLIMCLIFAMTVPAVPQVFAESAAAGNGGYDADAVHFALQLDLLSPSAEGELLLSQTVTRAELASILRKIIHTPALADATLPITDMETGDPLYGDVAAAIGAGLFRAPESGLFRPEEPAFAYQLVSSLLDILGYRPSIGDGKDWAAANKLGLLRGLSIGEMDVLNCGQAAKICYNAMDIPMMIQTKYGENAEWKVADSKRIYTEYWHAVSATGIVDGNEKTGLTAESGLKEGWISIGQKPYQLGETNADSLLGYRVEYWYTEDDTLVYLQKLSENRTLKIAADDIADAKREKIVYYPDADGREREAKLAGDVDVIYNDRALFDFTAADLKPKSGFLTLIDADNDNLYEVVKVYEYVNYYVTALDQTNQLLTDGLRMETVDFKDNGRLCVDIKSFQAQSGEYYPADFTRLTVKNVVSVMESRDKECVTAIVSSDKAGGTVTAVREKNGKQYVTVGETEYAVSDDFKGQYDAGNKKAIKIETGLAATFYLDFSGEIAFVSTDLSQWQYGFMSGAALEGTFSKQLKLRIFNDEGIWEDRDVADTVTFLGETKKDMTEVYGSLAQGGTVKPRMIKYRLRPDGKIGKLETPLDRSADVGYIGYDTEHFTKDAVMTDVKYKLRNRSFQHKYSMELTTTTMFYLPASAYAQDGSIIEDEVLLLWGNFFINDRKYSVEVYDSDEYFVPRGLIVTASATENYETDILYINEKTAILDSDGEETYLLEGIQGNTAVSYVCRDRETGEAVKVGDALKIMLQSNGRIRKLVRLASFADRNAADTVISLGKNAEKDVDTDFGLYAATVYDVDYTRAAVLTYIDQPTELTRFSGSYMKILTYRTKKQRFEVGDITQIHGAAQSTTPSRVFLHDRYLETRSLVVIDET